MIVKFSFSVNYLGLFPLFALQLKEYTLAGLFNWMFFQPFLRSCCLYYLKRANDFIILFFYLIEIRNLELP